VLQPDLPATARTEEPREELCPNSASHWARGGRLRHSGMSMGNRWEKGNGWREAKGIRRIGPVMFPRLDRNQRLSESTSPNSYQLRSFFISNRSSIHESEDFPSRSPGLEGDLGSYYLCLKGNVHSPSRLYLELSPC